MIILVGMDDSIEQEQENSLKFIRKLRKKLRQIERLEKTQRELTDDERMKVSLKHDIRSNLQSLQLTISEVNVSFGSCGSEPSAANMRQADKVEDDREEQKDDAALNRNLRPAERSVTAISMNIGDDIEPRQVKPESHVHETQVAEYLARNRPSKKDRTVKSNLRKFWKESSFVVAELKGHNDTITCVDALGKWFVSGSRDTTVKLWDAVSGKEMKNMGGHSGQVTVAKILPTDESDTLRESLDASTIQAFIDVGERQEEDEQIVFSGSVDCCIRLWLIPSGLFIKSIYNYNPVSALTYHCGKKYIIVGSGSGKLTVFDACSSVQIYNSMIHAGQITQIQILDDTLLTSSLDGDLKVWKITQNPESSRKGEISRSSELEFDLKSEDFDVDLQHSFENRCPNFQKKCIHSFALLDSHVYHGDDGANVKAWHLSTGEISRFRNHKLKVPGITDVVQLHNLMLFSTSYDLDSGRGSLNARSLHPDCYGAYIITLSNTMIPRLTSFCTQFEKDPKYFVTGGEKLLLWKFYESSESRPEVGDHDSVVIQGQYVVELTTPAEDHSDSSSDDNDITDAEDEPGWFWQKSKRKPSKKAEVPQTDSETDSETDNNSLESQTEEQPLDTSSAFSLLNWCTLL